MSEKLFLFPWKKIQFNKKFKIDLLLNDIQHYLDQLNNEQHTNVSYISVRELTKHMYLLMLLTLVVEQGNYQLVDMIKHLLQLPWSKQSYCYIPKTINWYYLVTFSCNHGVSSSWTLDVDGNGEGCGAKLNKH
jgi:hypothetical protein